MGPKKRGDDADVVRITAAPHNPGQDIDHRQRRYLISMAIRTLCFIGAVLAYKIPWLCGLLIVASFILPFFAVVVANLATPRVAGHLDGPGVGTGPDVGELSGPDHDIR
ncbi:DUF3099 domain-containing protein [Nocardioides marmoriginsengisoli]|uniref:DUF3099 domain-containing protein n=1 Tax=Nocardioides marmoriginsengisoli TaxID=661483 RepID=A0A3N0CRB1_9ACTN|nr:DUF3099 domain-containing protein [Nocardioides marmoriginsengisoli]RNL65811.1 DUF3099 domain-containing protein [Nocardioides marmoriginsengisoli]